jgi:hypothetical protein
MRPRTWFVLFSFLLPLMGARPASASQGAVAPAGTALNIRTTEPIYADYVQPGSLFTGIVEYPVEMDGQVVIPRGARATLEVIGVDQSSNLKGRDRINLRVRSVRFGGQSYAVSTNYVQFRGPSEGKRAARKGIVGGVIGGAFGGLIGGGTGAALGAAAGAGTGLAVAGSGKSHLAIPPETLLQFQFTGMTPIQ